MGQGQITELKTLTFILQVTETVEDFQERETMKSGFKINLAGEGKT